MTFKQVLPVYCEVNTGYFEVDTEAGEDLACGKIYLWT